MREIKNRFEDMALEQTGTEEAPQPPTNTARATTSARNVPTVDDDGEGRAEGEGSEDEWTDVHPGEDGYLCGEESEVGDDGNDGDDGDGDEVFQGTYGMGEY